VLLFTLKQHASEINSAKAKQISKNFNRYLARHMSSVIRAGMHGWLST
jgi:hypothetical protein